MLGKIAAKKLFGLLSPHDGHEVDIQHYDHDEEGYDILIVCHDCNQALLSINSDGEENVRELVGTAKAISVE